MEAKAIDPALKVWFRPEEAAAYLKVSMRTLQNLRWSGRGGPRFVKIGEGRFARVRYPQTELDAWIVARVRSSTTEVAPVRA